MQIGQLLVMRRKRNKGVVHRVPDDNEGRDGPEEEDKSVKTRKESMWV